MRKSPPRWYILLMMRRFRFRLALLMALAAGMTGAQTADDARSLEWKAVEGAYGYLVEIRDSAQETVFSRSTDKPSISFSLPPGDYEARITVLNKFLKPAAVSPWSKLSVRRAVKPDPASAEGGLLYAGARDQQMIVTGGNFIPLTEAYLEAAGQSIRGSIIEQSANRLHISFDLSGAKPGVYSLRLRNPPSADAEKRLQIRVLERTQPAVISVSRTEFTNDRVHRGIEVVGSGFMEGIQAFFQSPSGVSVKASSIIVESPQRLSLSWNAGDLEAGRWRLVLENPGGLKAEAPVPILLAAAPSETPGSSGKENERVVEVPVERVVEKVVEVPVEKVVEKIVEVPVERVVEKQVEVPVEKIVEVPVEKVVEKIVEVPVEKVVEKIVEVPVEKIVEVPVERVVEKTVEVPVEKIVEVPVESQGREQVILRDIPFTVTEERTVLVPRGGSGGLSILAGYPIIIGLGEYAELFELGFINASLALQADLGNGVLHMVPVFNLLAMEAWAVYAESPGREAIVRPYLRALQLGASVVLRSRFPIPLQVSGRVGLGTIFSWMEKTSPFTSVPSLEYSQDFCLQAGLSAFLEFKGGFTVEALAEVVPLFYALTSFGTLRFSLRAGWRFN